MRASQRVHSSPALTTKSPGVPSSTIKDQGEDLVEFHPPPRLLQAGFQPNDTNILVQSVSGDMIHCQLTYPYDKPTSVNDYKSTNSIVLFMHGNADDVHSSRSYCQWLADALDLKVISFDYPEYGFSSGDSTSEEGMLEAADCAFELIINKLKCEVSEVVLCGKSIGSFPAVSLAARSYCARIRGLVLISPVSSAARCVFDTTFVPNYLMHKLDSLALNNLSEISKVWCLVLLVHGKQDKLVLVDNSEALLLATNYHSQHPVLYVDAGHNDIESRHQALFLETLSNFVQTCMQNLDSTSSASPYEF